MCIFLLLILVLSENFAQSNYFNKKEKYKHRILSIYVGPTYTSIYGRTRLYCDISIDLFSYELRLNKNIYIGASISKILFPTEESIIFIPPVQVSLFPIFLSLNNNNIFFSLQVGNILPWLVGIDIQHIEMNIVLKEKLIRLSKHFYFKILAKIRLWTIHNSVINDWCPLRPGVGIEISPIELKI